MDMARKVEMRFEANIIRCLLTAVLPALLFIFCLLISRVFGFNYSIYIERLHREDLLMSKAIVGLVLGFIGLGIWFTYMLPASLKSLRYRHRIVSVNDGYLIVLGKRMCLLNQVRSFRHKNEFMAVKLIADMGEGILDCGNITLCKDSPEQISKKLNETLDGDCQR